MNADKVENPGAVAGQVDQGVRPVAWMWMQAAWLEGDVRGRGWYSRIDRQKPRMPWMENNLQPLYDQAALDAALALRPRDCRLCAHYRDGLTHAAHCVSVLRCEDSSAYRATQPVQFWEKRPAEQAPF